MSRYFRSRKRFHAPHPGRGINRKPPTANSVYVFDISGSMNGRIQGANGYVTKISALQEAFTVLLHSKAQHMPQDLVGCVLFGTRAQTLFPLTRSKDPYILQKVKGIRANGGATNMVVGLELGISMLEGRSRQHLRNLTLLSDGIATCPKEAVLDLARRAYKSRIRINTIGFGDGVNIDEALLQQVTSITHKGAYVNAHDMQALAQALLRAA